MKSDIDEKDSVKNVEEEKFAQNSSTDQNDKTQSNDNPLKQGQDDGKVTKDKDEGETEIKTDSPVILESKAKNDSKNTQSNVQKVEANPAAPVTKDDYKSKHGKSEPANSKLKKNKKKQQEAKKEEKSQEPNNITDVDI